MNMSKFNHEHYYDTTPYFTLENFEKRNRVKNKKHKTKLVKIKVENGKMTGKWSV